MTPLNWLLLAAGAGVAIVYVVWWFRSREEPVVGRAWAAALRAAALILAWLILINPTLPAVGGAGREDAVALLDASLSMTKLGAGLEGSLWRAARDTLARFERAWLFGGAVPRVVRVDSLPEAPAYAESRLAPALRAAAVAGARRAVVVSDGEIGDGAEAREAARRNGVALRFVTLRPATPELGIAEVGSTRWVEVGDTVEVRAELVARGAVAESVWVEVADEEGRVRAVASTRLPEAGRYAPLRLAFPAQGPPGYQRFVVRLAAPSPEPELRDNERAVYVQVVERPVGPVLISLRPDWEPSFLIPNLDRLADAPTTGYLRLGDWLVGLDSYRPVAVESVRRRARAAPLLVLHGYGPDAPDWARALAREARRLLVLPAGAGRFEVPGPNVRVGAPAAGEWYADAALPATPLALDLGGGALEGLPPLLGVRTIEAESAWSPLHLRRGRGGEPQPAVVVGQRGARRWAVAAAEGYWRWAFRSAAGRGLYRSLWTGVAGWLLADGPWAVAGLEPERRVVSRGELLRWVTPGAGAVDSLVVELSGEAAGEPVRLTAAAGDSLAVQLSPGRYRYVARAYRGGRLAAVAARGPVEVEAFTPELLPFAGALLAELEADEALRTGSSAGRRRRLATLGWPYLLLIALFCAEWAVRRVIGLR